VRASVETVELHPVVTVVVWQRIRPAGIGAGIIPGTPAGAGATQGAQRADP
jgi:hypothetical protein